MNELEKFEAEGKKIAILSAYNYVCVRCGRRAFSLAYRIPQSQMNLKKYGSDIIHHPFNMLPVCNSSKCNDAVSISNHPMLIERVAKEIQAKIDIDQNIPQ